MSNEPPPYGFHQQPPPPPPPQEVHVTLVTGTNLGERSTTVVCPRCNQTVNTRIEREVTSTTWLSSLLLCLMGFWCLSLCPFCCGCCYRTDHYCPRCGSFLGSYP